MERRELAQELSKNISNPVGGIFSQRKTDFEPIHIETPAKIKRFGICKKSDSKTEMGDKIEEEVNTENSCGVHNKNSKSEMEVSLNSTQIESISQSEDKIVDQDLTCFEVQPLCEVCSKPQDLITLSCSHSLCKSHLIDTSIYFIKSHHHNYLSNELNLRIKCPINTCKYEFNPKILKSNTEIQYHLKNETLNHKKLLLSSLSCKLCKDSFSSSNILESLFCHHFCFDCVTILRHFKRHTCSFCKKELIDLKEFNKSCENCGVVDDFTQLKLCKNDSLCFKCSYQSVIKNSCLQCNNCIQETILKKLTSIQNLIKKGIFN